MKLNIRESDCLKLIFAVLCLTAHGVVSESSVREKSFVSPPVNDSLPFYEVVVTTQRGEVLAIANASLAYRRGNFAELKEGWSFWAELDRKLAALERRRNFSDKASGPSDNSDNKCRLLSLSISDKNSLENSVTTKMDAPVIHDIQIERETEVGASKIHASHKSHPFYGVFLAVIAAGLVGASFIFQKKALIRTEVRKGKASFAQNGSSGEFAYLKQWVWWCGMLSMAFGEVLTFVAYSVAPAILITPLGALRVIVSALLSTIFLGERLNPLGKIGVLLSLVGSVMIVIHAPRNEKVKTFEQVIVHFTDSRFLFYCFVLIAATIILILHIAPRHGRTHVMVYISVCNIVGALCVLCGKGLGISLKEIGEMGELVYLNPIFWMLLLGNVIGILTQIVYLNKALAVFDTSVITPIKYVCTNVFLVFGSILLFQEFAYMSIEDIVGISCGFTTVVTGVVLLNLFKDRNVHDVAATTKR